MPLCISWFMQMRHYPGFWQRCAALCKRSTLCTVSRCVSLWDVRAPCSDAGFDESTFDCTIGHARDALCPALCCWMQHKRSEGRGPEHLIFCHGNHVAPVYLFSRPFVALVRHLIEHRWRLITFPSVFLHAVVCDPGRSCCYSHFSLNAFHAGWELECPLHFWWGFFVC